MRIARVLTLAAALAVTAAAQPTSAQAGRVCVFVPGVVSGSPIYEQLVAGAKRAVAEVPGSSLKVIEAGFNQAEWLGKLNSLAATGEFSLIVSSNPALPDLCAQAAASFPKVRFFVADAWMPGSPGIHTVLYNQLEQGYIVGYLAGLVTAGGLPGLPAAHKAGLVVAQRYPTLDKLIAPGFERGLKAADPKAVLETREIGNWYDATKASELAAGLMDAGATVLLPIAGGAGQGVVSAAKARSRAAVWFDGDGYALAPGTIIGCAVLRQEKLVYEKVKALLAQGPGSKLYGSAEVVDAKGGYVDFDGQGAAYKALPQALRSSFEAQLDRLRSGALGLAVSGL
ncbi:MAG: BMP family ABC transporter substrate-binding protein [Spirochaetaceae bacterium]|nr:BMP family ABC transporter substrate-binding protein [Spirochaetaceae bacterium]